MTINPLLLPPSRLELKVRATMVLIYNLNSTKGLYNCTRIIITKLTRFAISVCIIGSQFRGNVHGIFRISIINNKGKLL